MSKQKATQKSAYEVMQENIKRNAHTKVEVIVPPKSSSMVEVEILGKRLAHKAEKVFGYSNRCAIPR